MKTPNFYTAYRTIVENSKGNKYILNELNQFVFNNPFLSCLLEERNKIKKVITENKQETYEGVGYSLEILSAVQSLLEHFNVDVDQLKEEAFEKEINEMLLKPKKKKKSKKTLVENLSPKELLAVNRMVLTEKAFSRKTDVLKNKINTLKKTDKKFITECINKIKNTFKEDKAQASADLILLEDTIKGFADKIDSLPTDKLKDIVYYVYPQGHTKLLSISFKIDFPKKGLNIAKVESSFIETIKQKTSQLNVMVSIDHVRNTSNDSLFVTIDISGEQIDDNDSIARVICQAIESNLTEILGFPI